MMPLFFFFLATLASTASGVVLAAGGPAPPSLQEPGARCAGSPQLTDDDRQQKLTELVETCTPGLCSHEDGDGAVQNSAVCFCTARNFFSAYSDVGADTLMVESDKDNVVEHFRHVVNTWPCTDTITHMKAFGHAWVVIRIAMKLHVVSSWGGFFPMHSSVSGKFPEQSPGGKFIHALGKERIQGRDDFQYLMKEGGRDAVQPFSEQLTGKNSWFSDLENQGVPELDKRMKETFLIMSKFILGADAVKEFKVSGMETRPLRLLN